MVWVMWLSWVVSPDALCQRFAAAARKQRRPTCAKGNVISK